VPGGMISQVSKNIESKSSPNNAYETLKLPIKKRKASSFSEPFAIFMIYFVHLGWNKLRENRAVLLLKQ
jgi:hypothetical protein